MYDVIYIDPEGAESALATALDRQEAAELARRIAAERRAGRIVCPGLVRPVHCVCVVPESASASASAGSLG
jgi:hypothetical protein